MRLKAFDLKNENCDKGRVRLIQQLQKKQAKFK
jgi:hypothetical protein